MVLIYNTAWCYNKCVKVSNIQFEEVFMNVRRFFRLQKILSIVLTLTLPLFLFACAKEQTSFDKETPTSTFYEYDYILNLKSKKIHKPYCKTAELISFQNRMEYSGDICDLFFEGYSTCGNCF